MRYRYYGGGAFFILLWAIVLGLWINPFLWFILLLWLPLGGYGYYDTDVVYYGKSVSATPSTQGNRDMRLNF
tara:strand:- start:10070 stop:10285 length:216 start_codon:yes stop_codon:yes gene_type:complete